MSGARLNVSKSHGLLIGPWRSRSDLPVSLDRSSTCITVLGSQLSNDGEENWERKFQDLESVLTSWSSRSLSFHGQALIVNSLGLSMFWYLLSFTCLPDQILQRINTSVFSFVWKQKHEWLARSSVTERPSFGAWESWTSNERFVLCMSCGFAVLSNISTSCGLFFQRLPYHRFFWTQD